MSILKEYFVLRNGVKIPKIGFGTWQIPDDVVEDAVGTALKAGYRHIDTALAYQNERGVGKAVANSGIAREKIFITSKLPAEIKGYDAAMNSFDTTMKNIGFDYLDLYLIHAPWPWFDRGGDYSKENVESWKAFEKLYKEGRVRAIGISNFVPSDITPLLDSCEIVPFVNQIAFHVGRRQEETVDYCRKLEILIEAYSPLATGRALKDQYICSVANKYGVSAAQLLIKYTLQKGMLPLPKSVNPLRIKENVLIDTFVITADDIAGLDAINTQFR